MLVTYPGKSDRVRYACQRGAIEYAEPTCQSLVGTRLDELVARQVLTALEPAALELSLGAGAEVQREREKLARRWRQRLGRARYEADRSARQYHAVEPENRLVARELELRWEQTLAVARDCEDGFDRFQREQPGELTTAERDMIRSLASDIPALWCAPTTSASDRRAIVRHLVERVEVAVQGETEWVDVAIHWAGGFVSRHELRRPVRRLEQLRDFPALMARVLELHAAGESSDQIAEQLNFEGAPATEAARDVQPCDGATIAVATGAHRATAPSTHRGEPAAAARMVAERFGPRVEHPPADDPQLAAARLDRRPEAPRRFGTLDPLGRPRGTGPPPMPAGLPTGLVR
jgi:hypothetical protein